MMNIDFNLAPQTQQIYYNIINNNPKFKELQKKTDMVKTSYAYHNLVLASKGMDDADKEWNELDKKKGLNRVGSTLLAFGGSIVAQQGYAKAGLVCLIDLVHSFAIAVFSTILAGICLGKVEALNNSTWKYWNHSYIALVGFGASVLGYMGLHELVSKDIIKHLGHADAQEKFVKENPDQVSNVLKIINAATSELSKAVENSSKSFQTQSV